MLDDTDSGQDDTDETSCVLIGVIWLPNLCNQV